MMVWGKGQHHRCPLMTRIPRRLAKITLLLSFLSYATIDISYSNTFLCEAFVVPQIKSVVGKKETRSITKIFPNAKLETVTTLLRMNFLSDFFGSFQDKMNTGGSYNLGIDYDTLSFPGPEVGAMAISITQIRRGGNENALPPSRSPSLPHLELTTLAGGCFWGLELALQRCPGVEHTLVGYTQGSDSEVRPNYEQVSAGNTGHCEAVIVYFDPSQVDYETLLRTIFLDRIDISTINGQGKDFGRQYRTGIYFHTEKQEEIAQRLLKEEVATNPKYATTTKVATEIRPAKAFWPAEEYHQKYLEKGGRFGVKQSAEKGNTDEIRCYG